MECAVFVPNSARHRGVRITIVQSFSHRENYFIILRRTIRVPFHPRCPQSGVPQIAVRGGNTADPLCSGVRLHVAATLIEVVELCGPAPPVFPVKFWCRAPDSDAWPAARLRQRGSEPSQTPKTRRRLPFCRERKMVSRSADDPSHGVPRHPFDGALKYPCVLISAHQPPNVTNSIYHKNKANCLPELEKRWLVASRWCKMLRLHRTNFPLSSARIFMFLQRFCAILALAKVWV